LFKFNLWLTGVLLKVTDLNLSCDIFELQAVPCMLLIWFTIALTWKLHDRREKQHRLYNSIHRIQSSHRRNLHLTIPDRTSYMLIVMLVTFLMTELPQGCLAILNAMYTDDVHRYIYLNIGEMLDLLSLINCNVDVIVYCCLSSRYRHTFLAIVIDIQSIIVRHHFTNNNQSITMS